MQIHGDCGAEHNAQRQCRCSFLDQGRVGLIPGREAFTAGYQRCLIENHIPPEEELVFNQIENQLMQKIASHAITGVVSAHYETAARLYDAVRKLRYELRPALHNLY